MSAFSRQILSAGGAVALLLLAGCEAPTPYQAKDSPHSPGYSDQRLAENRYRVTYSGNAVTSRDTVENYLLLRAAEVTLAAGYGFFMFDTRDTEAKTSYHSDFAGWPGWPGRRGWYWHNWDFDGADAFPITRYEAYAEIIMLNGDQAKNEPRAMRAQDVIDRLRPAAAPPPPAPSHTSS
jgi:hypothetical protein